MSESLDCSKCGRVCKDRKGLSKHERHCNGVLLDLTCPDIDCGKIFTTRSNLYKHIAIVK